MVFYIHRLSPLGVLLPVTLELHFLSWRGLICVYTWVSTRVKNDNWDDDGGDVLSRMQSSLFLQSFIGFASFKTHKRCFVGKRNQPTMEQIIM